MLTTITTSIPIGDTNWGATANANWSQIKTALTSLQLVQTVDTAAHNTSSLTLVSLGVSVTLPAALRSTASGVLIRATVPCTTSVLSTPRITVFRNGVDLTPAGTQGLAGNSIPFGSVATIGLHYLDMPGTTTPPTYTLYWRTDAGTTSISTYPIILMAEEIA